MNSSVAGGLLERERELEALRAMVGSASIGGGRAVVIQGEPGIGKTSLLGAACELASEAGMSILTARAGELEGEYAWGVVRALFDALLVRASAKERERLFDAAAGLARPALGLEAGVDSVEDVSYSTLHGLYWLTVNLAQRRPQMLAVDDLQWADLPSLRFIAHLVPRIADLPILLAVATRPPGAQPTADGDLLARIAAEPSLTTLRPAALSQACCLQLVRAELGGGAGERFCLACHEVSGGNPFLLRELVSELADEQIAPSDESAHHVRRMSPDAIAHSVLLRLARLPADALGLARAVAVLGACTELRPAQLLAGLGSDDAAAAARALIRAGILAGDETLAFVHPLVRSAVYQDLFGPERSLWHRRAARLLFDDGAPLQRITPHLLASLPDGDPWTVERLRAAAAEAAARGAPEIAADCLRRATAEPPDSVELAEVLLELGEVEATYDPAAALPHLTEALTRCPQGSRRAAIALVLGEALTLAGQLSEAVRVLGDGISELQAQPSDLRSALEEAQLGAARWEPSAQPRRRELVDRIRRRAAGGEALDPRLHGQLAIEATAEGTDRRAAVYHAREALSAAERPSGAGASTVPEAILVLAFADLPGEAGNAIADWVALVRRRVWPLATALGSSVQALVALYRGEISDAVAGARGAIIPVGEARLAPVTVAFLVEALIERGEIEAARSELVERGLDGELPLAWGTTPLLLARGRLHAAAGDHRAAIDDLLTTGERADAWGVRNPAMMPWRSSAALSLSRLGARDQAIALADEEVVLARRWGAPRAIGVALRAAGVAHDGDEGLELLREAVAALESSSAPLEHARALTDLGSALRRSGRRAEARERLRSGLDLAHRLGGIAVAERARTELTIAGARPRRDALRGRDALTASELRVAQLAAEGRINREIAQALFVTLRTVEAHLTSSYAKLGITSRRQLAAALAGATTSRSAASANLHEQTG